MLKILFKDPESNSLVKLGTFPFNLQCDHEAIEHYLELYAWHKQGSNAITTLGYYLKCGLSVKNYPRDSSCCLSKYKSQSHIL